MRHHCVPGLCSCESPDYARSKTFTALLENYFTLGGSSSMPSKSRWGACTSWAGDITAGIMCHNILPRCFSKAFPYKPNDHVAQADGAADDDDYRAYARGKVKRSACVRNDKTRLQLISLAAYLDGPEHLRSMCPV